MFREGKTQKCENREIVKSTNRDIQECNVEISIKYSTYLKCGICDFKKIVINLKTNLQSKHFIVELNSISMYISLQRDGGNNGWTCGHRAAQAAFRFMF